MLWNVYGPSYKLVFARGPVPDCGIAPYAKSEMYTGLVSPGVGGWFSRPSLGQSGRIKLGMGLLLPPRLDPKSVVPTRVIDFYLVHCLMKNDHWKKNHLKYIIHTQNQPTNSMVRAFRTKIGSVAS